jgi:hypothetical protein
MSKPNDIVSIILQERGGIAGKSTGSTGTGAGFSLGSFLINIVWVLLLVFVIVALSAYFSPSCNEESSWLTYTLCLYRNFTTKIFEVTNAFVKKDVEATATESPEKEKEKKQEKEKEEVTNDDETAKKYEEDSSSSNIQEGPGKKGWCFIGKDRGVRSCAKVGLNDTCMSGDIFPTSDICVNPRLRA